MGHQVCLQILCFNYHSVDQSHIFSFRLGVTDQIKISFLNFNVESHSSCRYIMQVTDILLLFPNHNASFRYDYIDLRDGGDDTSVLVGK